VEGNIHNKGGCKTDALTGLWLIPIQQNLYVRGLLGLSCKSGHTYKLQVLTEMEEEYGPKGDVRRKK